MEGRTLPNNVCRSGGPEMPESLHPRFCFYGAYNCKMSLNFIYSDVAKET